MLHDRLRTAKESRISITVTQNLWENGFWTHTTQKRGEGERDIDRAGTRTVSLTHQSKTVMGINITSSEGRTHQINQS